LVQGLIDGFLGAMVELLVINGQGYFHSMLVVFGEIEQ